MFAKSAVVVALLAAVVVAQTNSTPFDPTTVDLTTKTQWCQGEINTCGTLCSGSILLNSCDPTSLNYTCTCTANSSTPGLQYYAETIPSYECQQIYQNCITAGQGDAAAQALCTQAQTADCGTLSTTNFTAVATTSSASSTASSTAASTAGSSSAASTTTSKNAAATMLAIGQSYGSGVVAAGVAAAFGILL